MLLSERAASLKGSQTSGMRNRARKLKAEGVRVVNFAAGELDQDTSNLVKEAVRRAIDEGRTQYTDTLGIQELRERLAVKVTDKTGQAYTADEVGFTAGAKQALFHAIFVTFGPGDEVIVPAPYWVTFPEQVRLAGAVPVFLSTVEHDFQINIKELERKITPRTRGILLNTPHNPTGVVYSEDVLKGIAQLALKYELTCVFDECYDELTYSPAVHRNIVKLVPEMKSRTILIGSLSKTYCIAGWRAGFFAAPKAIVKAIANVQSHTSSNPSNLVQYAALAALEDSNYPFVNKIRKLLTEQRAVALQCMSECTQLSYVVPDGAFYLFPDIRKMLHRSFKGEMIENVDMLAEMLLQHAHIAVVPGSAFGSESHIRISYAIPAEEIERGLKSLQEFINVLE